MKYYKVHYSKLFDPMFYNIIVMAKNEQQIRKHFENKIYINMLYETKEVNKIDYIVK